MDGKINTAESEYWVNRSGSWRDGQAAALQRYRDAVQRLGGEGGGVEGRVGVGVCGPRVETALRRNSSW